MGCRDARGQGAQGGEHSAGQQTSQVTIQKILLLVTRVVGVYKGALGLGVVVILVVVLLRLSGRIHGDGVGTVLAAAGDVISSEDPKNG